jgi:5,10-methylenetetrahydromethanopterin reductase
MNLDHNGEFRMEISCAFPTTLESPAHIALAEQLGFDRAWLYDTPQQSPDVWMSLALAAGRTERIGLGPGVLVPTLRHPMTNAAATATLEALAPGRVAVGFGTGFSGRRAMGYRGITWAFMEDYIRAYRGLLRGETVEWQGARMTMLHPEGHAVPRPVDVPIIISAQGPKGAGVAHRLGDGLYVSISVPEFATEFDRVSLLFWGTILDEGEDPASERVRAAGGPGWALTYHGAYEFGGPVRELPGGDAWMDVVERTAPEERHLAVHEQHCVGLNEADAAAWAAGGAAMLTEVTVSGTAAQVRARLSAFAEQGVTELVYQPCGPDIRLELERFLDAARQAVAETGRPETEVSS